MKRSILLALLALSACDRPFGLQAEKPEPKAEIGRWAMMAVPGSTTVRENEGRLVTYAWRLDTVTGTLEMCAYSEYPVQTSKTGGIDPTVAYCGHPVGATER